jgi:putative tryptophan/tyrosine transport system ATP-binding protein
MLILRNINVTFGKSSKLERKILNNLSLDIKEGEFVVVIGGNGAGKSTMLNVISGFLTPDFGQVIIDGHDATNMSYLRRSAVVSKVVQDPRVGTMENMTLFENMAFAFKRGQRRGLTCCFNDSNRKLFQKKLQMLNMGLENLMDELVSHLSGGQRQAVSLVMSLLSDSKILLLDEITAALDPGSTEAIMQLTAKMIKEEKRTCIMITHNMDHAIHYGDRLLFLQNGTFIADYDADSKSKLHYAELASHFL